MGNCLFCGEGYELPTNDIYDVYQDGVFLGQVNHPNFKPMRGREIFKMTNNLRYTKDDIEKLHDFFVEMDADKAGSIGISEFGFVQRVDFEYECIFGDILFR
jgi:ubiquinone biosynthesis protein Coq4